MYVVWVIPTTVYDLDKEQGSFKSILDQCSEVYMTFNGNIYPKEGMYKLTRGHLDERLRCYQDYLNMFHTWSSENENAQSQINFESWLNIFTIACFDFRNAKQESRGWKEPSHEGELMLYLTFEGNGPSEPSHCVVAKYYVSDWLLNSSFAVSTAYIYQENNRIRPISSF